MGFVRSSLPLLASVALAVLGTGCIAPSGSTNSKLLSDGGLTADTSGPLTVANNIAPPNDSGVSKVVAGLQHTCAIRAGRLSCWGLNQNGEIGNGESGTIAGIRDPLTGASSSPRVVLKPYPVLQDGVSDVAVGYEHTCAIRGGDLLCWGSNAYGQLGLGSENTGVSVRPVSILQNAKQVVARGRWTCAVSNAGQLVCFGTRLMRVGAEMVPQMVSSTPRLFISSGVRSVAMSTNHACAIVAEGLKCFGMNAMGEVGNGSLDGGDVSTPVDVVSSGVAAVAASDGRSCLVKSGRMQCFGASLGDREIDRAAGGWKVPTANPYDAVFWDGIGPGLQISASGTVLASTGDLYYGSYFHSNGVAPKIAIGVTQFDYTENDLGGCMMFRNHAVKCWGPNLFGQLGTGRRAAEEFPISKAKDVQF